MQAHFALPVTDLKRAMTFYQALGFVPGEAWQRLAWNMTGQMMTHASKAAIELIAHPDNARIQRPSVPEVLHLALPVADVEQSLAELIEAGATILRPVTEGIKVRRLTFIADPDGNVIELFEPKA